MKPAAFDYLAPESVDEALAALRDHGDDVKVLAGGQSLIPLMSFRLARPEMIVDINRIDALAGTVASDRTLSIGAMTRQAALERTTLVAPGWSLLHEALAFVAHAAIRNRGTVGGSAVHADPAAELPVALTALDATFVVRSTRGERALTATDFFHGYLTTATAEDELLLRIDVPAAPAGTGAAFEEFARRSGDYALGGAAAVITVDAAGTCRRARVVLLGAADVPLRAREAEAALVGRSVDDDAARETAALAAAAVRPLSNMHGDAAYRREVIGAMCRRAVVRAAEAAG